MTTLREVWICKKCKKTLIVACKCPVNDTDVVNTEKKEGHAAIDEMHDVLQKSDLSHENEGKNVGNITKWEPIETALDNITKIDDTPVLLNIGAPWPVVGVWSRSETKWVYANFQLDLFEGEWIDSYFNNEWILADEPTHWMHLPAPPEVKG